MSDERFKDITHELSPYTLALNYQAYDLFSDSLAGAFERVKALEQIFAGLQDDERRSVLDGEIGEELLMVYMGVKPLMRNDTGDYNCAEWRTIAEKFGLEYKEHAGVFFIVNPSAATLVISSMPEIYGADETIEHFLEATYPEDLRVFGTREVKLGLLLGYPYDACVGYLYGTQRVAYMVGYITDEQFISKASPELLDELKRRLLPENLEELAPLSEEIIDTYTEELVRVLNDLGAEGVSESDFEFIFRRRVISTYGFSYVIGGPIGDSPESEDYVSAINNFYISSGLKSFVEGQKKH